MAILRKKFLYAWDLACALALTVSAVLVYLPTLHYEFQFDDLANINKHFNIRHYSFSSLFFTGTRWISYWVNSIHYKIGRFDPFSYRVGNVIIHSINGLLIYVLFLFLLRRNKSLWLQSHARMIAIFNALLFLLHPVQTQTVSYVIQGQLEGMVTTSILLMALLISVRAYSQSILLKSFLAGIISVIAFFACGTKEIAIVTPFLLILVDWFFIAQGSVRELFQRVWIYITTALIIWIGYLYLLKPTFFKTILGLSYQVQNNIGNVITHEPSTAITPYIYCISQFKVILHYLWIFIWPRNISVEYDWRLVRGFSAPDCLFPLLGLLAIIALSGYLLYRNKIHPAIFGLLWFAIAIAPRSSIVPSPELVVDYKTYPASVGWLFVLALLLVIMLDALSTFFKQKYFLYISGIYILCLVMILASWTIKRNTIWRSGLEFWNDMIKHAPTKARAYNNYGVELSQKLLKFAESIPYFLKAISMDSNYPDPCNNLAVAYSQIGEIDKAIEALKQGLRINPYYPEGYNNIASFLITKKDFERARIALNNALHLRPYYGKALFNMGRLHMEEGKHEEAWQYFKMCCTQGDLDNEIGFDMYGRMSLMLQKYDDAIRAYSSVLNIDPRNAIAIFNLANAYVMSGKVDQGIATYHAALQITPDDPRIWYNVGEAYNMINKYSEALDAYQKVLPFGQQYPQVYSRLAYCHEKLGNPMAAYQELRKTLACNISDEHKQQTRHLLEQLKTQYHLAV